MSELKTADKTIHKENRLLSWLATVTPKKTKKNKLATTSAETSVDFIKSDN